MAYGKPGNLLSEKLVNFNSESKFQITGGLINEVGFIGLGIMGKPMAKNLLKAGHQVCVNDFHKEAVEELVAAGATAGANNAEVAKA